MRFFLVFSAVFALSANMALAGEGNISDRSLSKMGLQGMKPMTDAQGLAVRGQAFAIVGGFSHAKGGAPSGGIQISNGSFIFQPTFSQGTSVSAGGFSFAKAH